MVTVFYSLVLLSGLAGNLLVCLVVVRAKQLHSAMNYYLISLALADITIILLGNLAQQTKLLDYKSFGTSFGMEFYLSKTKCPPPVPYL